jgi:NitT/TauT family transport system substrate-binding protein
VFVLVWFQNYPNAVIIKAGAGIVEPADLAGRNVGIPGFFGASYVGYAGLLSANGLALEDVETTEIGFTQVEALLTDQVEAIVGYVNNEPIQLMAQGEEVNVIAVADYVDMVANGIVTNEATIAAEPELVAGFVRATLRGLADTLADPATAFEVSKSFVEGLEDSRLNVLEASLDLWRAETLGLTDGQSWENTQAVLQQVGFLDGPVVDLEAAYSNHFVTGDN